MTHLVPIEAEEVERLRLIRDHEWNDLSPNDERLLDGLVARYHAASERTGEELTIDELIGVIDVLTWVRDEGPGLSQFSGPGLKKLGRRLLRLTASSTASEGE